MEQALNALKNARKETLKEWMYQEGLGATVFGANAVIGRTNTDVDRVFSICTEEQSQGFQREPGHSSSGCLYYFRPDGPDERYEVQSLDSTVSVKTQGTLELTENVKVNRLSGYVNGNPVEVTVERKSMDSGNNISKIGS
ncbi:uncharacterized protein BDV17DRAFT_287250 [Aspergillus undulatus]|uniref:uncharacterized protein n=1 Tax=Aspergillus undulatus TaxID=1810928 RepID=UPI003CCD97F2